MTRHRIRRACLPFVLLLLTAACSVLQLPTEPGSVLFQDDFSRPTSGWDRYHDQTYASDYADGGYRIHVLAANTDGWATPGLSLADVQVEVDASKIGGPDDNVFGVICRYQDPRNFYFFLVSSDGYTGIGVYKDGRRRLLTDKALLPHRSIVQGGATNHLRADCVGFRLDLYINGQWVAGVASAEWPHGDVGLMAGTYQVGGTDILFDNFSVLKASP